MPSSPDPGGVNTIVKKNPLTVTRRPERFVSNDRRVIPRLFMPGQNRVRGVVDRILALTEAQVVAMLEGVRRDFTQRHRDVNAIFEEHFAAVIDDSTPLGPMSDERRLLIGAYFTMEYAVESAALFNPSIVPHPDQAGLPAGALRFLMSLRATGEGHISSIVFRSGVVFGDGHIEFDDAAEVSNRMRSNPDMTYDRDMMHQAIVEMGAWNEQCPHIFNRLPASFEFDKLFHVLDAMSLERDCPTEKRETIDHLLWLARSNYELRMPTECDSSAMVIFPTSENESNGIEDLRLVHFTDDDGSLRYFGTYTAYNGSRILPQLLETDDFHNIRIRTLAGENARDKGMALFPRKIDGQFVMVSRLDGENLFLMRSPSPLCWPTAEKLQAPRRPWELMQIGNCGSPLETDAGWLLITHGVGPMRRYCIGATLLDRDHPERVLASLEEPLLMPTEEERNGYVPNVVYSCGSLIHHDQLIIPYAMSDAATSFATVPIQEVLNHLR